MQLTHKVIATERDASGKIIRVQEGHNTVTNGNPTTVDNGRVMVLDYITGKDEYYDSTDEIGKMKLGTGTPGNGGLGTPTGSYKTTTFPSVMDISNLSAPELVLRGTWDAGDGALSGITEAGLFSETGLELFAYKTFTPALSKTAGGTLEIDWTITAS
jgi:hypothetical protein